MFAYVVYLVVLVGALLVIFGQLMPLATSSFVNSYADWRTNGGPAGIIIFLIVIIQQAERKVATSQVIGKLKLEAATSLANQEKLTERQTLIDMLTHELKNPLGTIRFALASLKKQSQVDQDALARVTRMDRSVERFNELFEHVAHSNKIDRFELTDEKEVVDAQELIEDLISDLPSEGHFRIEIEEGAVFFTHRRMLSVVLENLISNAYKYDDRRVPIFIRAARQEGMTVVEITNSIDPSIRPDESKLFDRYYRHDGVQSLPGMGIGLSLVMSAAEKIQTKVSCHIDADLVTFKVEVPQ
jgi:signal transduction histidine kinase